MVTWKKFPRASGGDPVYEFNIKDSATAVVQIYSNRVNIVRKKSFSGNIIQSFPLDKIRSYVRSYELHSSKETRIEVSWTLGTTVKMKKQEA